MNTQSRLEEIALDQKCINTIRFLAVDAVQKANSGHPGTPMGLAPLAYVLWTRHLRFNPKDPAWFDRDRFVLSNGHASMLQYAMLYLTGYDLTLDEIKNFRQWGSRTAGHPESTLIKGIEVTTGPLGQGFANGVGMGVAEQFLASTFNQPEHKIVDHHTYVFCGDGCLEEGITSEASSFAGHHQLGKLIYFYDDNKITIDGPTSLTFTEDVHKRYLAYGWHVAEVHDANDLAEIDHAIHEAKNERDRPSMIIVHSHIGYGSPNKQDTSKAHGSALGKDEVLLTKDNLNWPTSPEFLVPNEVLKHMRASVEKGAALQNEWDEKFASYNKAYAKEAKVLQAAIECKLPKSWEKSLPVFSPKDGPMATRTASGKVLNAIAAGIPTLIGGSADLNESTFVKLEEYGDFEPSPLYGGTFKGRMINFGIREHAMGAILNGMAAHRGTYSYGSTFFCFSDYMRPAVRLAAVAGYHSIFVWTHDSVGLGEDGPTHQPVEHLMALRAIPHLNIIRPADANETAVAWKVALERNVGPTGLVLSRQKLPIFDHRKCAPAAGLERGAYVLSEASNGKPDAILIATGSEVSLALEAQELLEKSGVHVRVVSMPSFELFEEQKESYKEEVLPEGIACRLSIEMGIATGWERYVGAKGASLSIDHFGASAPAEKIMEAMGFTSENIASIVKELMADPKSAQKKLWAFTHKHPLGHA
jgi:transketolase